ncbi:tannase/feruloyl esterase family alpha/beta hydrolase [Psittacicella gerlachiana]|uniref:Tannase/feruloyl esterase family alpha/beta hydrolase n=1 Tax=Psittacicella gerlachiana TaxID=2028574 RepID=A0A3A1YDF7_9GAMM|nr:tannase/feruloyl esterase family alpha/beta hydrolase [Psittacicella gerlachiana]RIY36192.1 tannase/feruloyl esterase family alpha/beta hydrolase [Psittacicella gerlachiana]
MLKPFRSLIYTSLATSLAFLGFANSSFASKNQATTKSFNLEACQNINALNLGDNVKITQVSINQTGKIPADPMSAFTGGSPVDLETAPHCVIRGIIDERVGADSKPYGTQFELRLPSNWNQAFLFQGGGGVDGFVAPAVGSVPINTAKAVPALSRGYAVVSMDGGHPNPTPEFGLDQQARLDFAYQAIGKVVTIAKQIVTSTYGQKPTYSFFMGCSNGGREAMIAAQRYPTEFNGVIAVNAGFRLSRANVAQQWDYQQFMQAAPRNAQGEKILANALTQEDLDKVQQVILKQCDARDGLSDGIINAWESCKIDPNTLPLSAEKIQALTAVMNGAVNSKGEQIYAGWYWDSGINQPDWRRWKLGTSQIGKPNSLGVSLGSGSLVYYFMTPSQPNFDLEKFDFDRDTPLVYQTGAINDAISTDLSTFFANDGKLIVVTGASDPVFSAKDQVEWYQQMLADTAKGKDQSRLFVLPGMNHCGGGNGLDDVDPLSALERWNQTKVAPEQILARGTQHPSKEMPVCAYPQVATYVGGDPKVATSYSCKVLP